MHDVDVNVILAKTLKLKIKELAEDALKLQYSKAPEHQGKNTPVFNEKSIRDTEYNLLYLIEAVLVSSPTLFSNYLIWFKDLLEGLNLPLSSLVSNIECIREVINTKLNNEEAIIVSSIIDAGLESMQKQHLLQESFLNDDSKLSSYAKEYLKLILNGDRAMASNLVLNLVNEGFHVRDIYIKIFQDTQYEIGRLWQINKISVAQEHYCTASTQLIMGQLYPLIFTTPKHGHVFVGISVGRELHELGIRMVADFMELSGWSTYYLGSNIPNTSIIDTIIKEEANVLGISATMTFHIDDVIKLIKDIRSDEKCSNVKIIVGGYPFNIDRNLWEKVGADGFSYDAQNAVEVANKLIYNGVAN